MPVIDVITFKLTDGHLNSPPLQLYLQGLKDNVGILSAWHGPQVEDPTNYHLIVFWNTVGDVDAAAKGSSYPSPPEGLLSPGSTFQRRLLHINEYPRLALESPITDITYMFLKENKTYERDLEPILIKFSELASGAKGAYWGECIDDPNVSIIMIGWNSVQEHYDAGKIPAYKELNDSAVPVVTFDLRHVPFEKIF